MKESILAVFEQVFVNEPIESFEQSWSLIIYWFTTSPYFILLILILSWVVGILYLCFLCYKTKDPRIIFLILFQIGFFAPTAVKSNLYVKERYFDNVVLERFLPQLSPQQLTWLEQEKIKGIKDGKFKNDLSERQKMNLEPIKTSIKFSQLKNILAIED